MLSFFRINDPYRLVFVLVLLMIFRLPFIIYGIPLTIPELKWMLVGEAMVNGKMLYRDIWENIGPLSAFTYQILDFLFGRSQLAYQLLSLVLVFIQAIIFNRLLLINKAFNENTYVPALIYAICMSMTFEFLTLSPVLMSITFVLLAINNIFKRIDNFTKDELFLYTGLYLGIATLFYFPAFVFFITTLLSLILFTNAIPRRLMLMSFGYAQILIILILYYYWYDVERELYFQFFSSPFSLERNHFINGNGLFKISLLFGMVFFLSLIKLYSRNYYVNFQVKFQSVLLITLIGASITIFLVPELSSFHLIVFVPVLSFFITHLFLLVEKRTKAEIMFFVFVASIFTYQFLIDKNLKWIGQQVDYAPVIVTNTEYDDVTTNKNILVLGTKSSIYNNSTFATPYLNWELAKNHLENMEYYDVITDVFKNFSNDPPEVIIDLKGTVPELFRKMPTIELKYSQIRNDVYILKD